MVSAATFSVDDLGDFLIEKGIPVNIVTAFIGKLECRKLHLQITV